MQFPKGKATDTTEQIMLRIKGETDPHEKLSVWQYNRIYEQIWEVLAEEFGEVNPWRSK